MCFLDAVVNDTNLFYAASRFLHHQFIHHRLKADAHHNCLKSQETMKNIATNKSNVFK